mmetsp:Transcript_28989/g.52781  ORF Transcript_28989/g.52781 Transcript_28989/m.52781 type:complete len:207 (+) Transcript_28989:408-1028(+)
MRSASRAIASNLLRRPAVGASASNSRPIAQARRASWHCSAASDLQAERARGGSLRRHFGAWERAMRPEEHHASLRSSRRRSSLSLGTEEGRVHKGHRVLSAASASSGAQYIVIGSSIASCSIASSWMPASSSMQCCSGVLAAGTKLACSVSLSASLSAACWLSPSRRLGCQLKDLTPPRGGEAGCGSSGKGCSTSGEACLEQAPSS